MKTQEQLAEAMQVCKRTVSNKIKQGKIKVVKVGHLVRITNEEFERVLREGV